MSCVYKYVATMNIHLLEHVPTCVKNWGPLWAYSCFAFEGMNAHLKHVSLGTRDNVMSTMYEVFTRHGHALLNISEGFLPCGLSMFTGLSQSRY